MKELRRSVGRRVVVNTTGAEAFDATLEAASKDGVTLGGVRMVEPRTSDLPGRVYVPAAQVAWVQVV